MIKSVAQEMGIVEIPFHEGEIKMLPFDLSDISSVPDKFMKLVEDMISGLPIKQGIAYLTVDGKTITEGNTQRRGGLHIDGNYIPEKCKWGSGGGGWKVGEGARILSSEHHKLSYENENGGMLIVSDFPACKGIIGEFKGKAYIGGDCSRIDTGSAEEFILKPNIVYYGNSQFLHESLPIMKTVHRNMVRITLPLDYQPIIN